MFEVNIVSKYRFRDCSVEILAKVFHGLTL